MKTRRTGSSLRRVSHVLVMGGVMSVLSVPLASWAEDTNTVELIKQLQRRIEELEQKVKALERAKGVAEPPKDTPSEKRLGELDQKVRELERQRQLDREAAEARAREMPRLSVGDEGFALASANGNFALQLKGVLQVDSRTFLHDAGIAGNDGFLLRRARPILEGTVFRDFEFLFVPDFAGSSPQIFDAYLNYRYSPAVQLQAGKFKPPVGLEYLQVDYTTWFNERAFPTDLVPGRDLGVELHGDLFRGALNYAAGLFNGVGDGRNSSNADFEDDKAFVGRIFLEPFKNSSLAGLQGLGFGLAGSYEGTQGPNTTGLPQTTGGSLPGFITAGQQQFFAYNPTTNAVVAVGDHWRLSPQGYWFYGPLGLMGEYAISEQEVSRTGAPPQPTARLENTAWQIAVAWVLTGEDASYGGVIPRYPFNPARGNWGAWELLGRYSALNIDSAAFPAFADPLTSARSAGEWSVGLDWFLNRNVSVRTSFSHTSFDGGGGKGTTAPAAVTRKDEDVVFTRMQLAF